MKLGFYAMSDVKCNDMIILILQFIDNFIVSFIIVTDDIYIITHYTDCWTFQIVILFEF